MKKAKRDRLASAKNWIKTYRGNNHIHKYCKKYKVNKICAMKELRILGVEISEQREEEIRRSMGDYSLFNKRRKAKREQDSDYGELFGYDENFAFIAGFTAGGAPYGTTHEEMKEMEEKEQNPDDNLPLHKDDYDLPF